MTPREQLAEQLEREAAHDKVEEGFAWPMLEEAAAELRKVCRTCQHFMETTFGETAAFRCGRSPVYPMRVPSDGSGGCSHGWEAKT